MHNRRRGPRQRVWRHSVAIPALLLLALAFGACGSGGEDGEVATTGAGGTPAESAEARPTAAGGTVAADGEVAPTTAGGNLFANPSFEEGGEPWISLQSAAWGTPFSVSDAQAQSGDSSALLELRSEAGVDTRVYGVVQEVSPETFPEVISGHYFVDRWEQGTPKQYLQFVVIVFNAENLPQSLATNHQIRYVLAGVDEQPIQIGNARFVLVDTGGPQTGQWVRFERNVREDFEELWGVVPEGFDAIRVLFEVRWDERSEDDGPSAADVYYDDLYLGSSQ